MSSRLVKIDVPEDVVDIIYEFLEKRQSGIKCDFCIAVPLPSFDVENINSYAIYDIESKNWIICNNLRKE